MNDAQEFKFLNNFKAINTHPSQKVWNEYNHLKSSLFSLRYNYLRYHSHHLKLLNLNIININGTKRWHQQKISFTLIGNFLTSFQSAIERFSSQDIMSGYRNSVQGQLMAVLRNYHIHIRNIDPILNNSIKRIDNLIIEDDEEYFEVAMLIDYLNDKIIEKRNVERSQSVLEFITSNYHSKIPLMSIFDENFLQLERIMRSCLISFIKSNENDFIKLLMEYEDFLKSNHTKSFNYLKDIIRLKYRYLRLGKRLLKNEKSIQINQDCP